ncbi:uncharacterized protein [Nicotiana tomentosiformis]|uniref:uncharacterized protein n=1 Tax=Nicotiana tomentosiformis TaxID=4098 RepID=UPI00388C73B9
MGRGAAQPANSSATTSTAPLARGTPAPAGHGAARGGAQNSGGLSRFYAMLRHEESEASPDVVTGFAKLDCRTRTVRFEFPNEPIIEWEGDDVVPMVDLLLLDMVDFEVILGMDWLFSYHAILDSHAKTVTLVIPGLPRYIDFCINLAPVTRPISIPLYHMAPAELKEFKEQL